MVAPRQNNVPFMCVGIGLGHGRSRRERDLYAIDDDMIGTGFAGGCDYLGERVLALPTWHRLGRSVQFAEIVAAQLFVVVEEWRVRPGHSNHQGDVLARELLALGVLCNRSHTAP
jgi:hypothetical protein